MILPYALGQYIYPRMSQRLGLTNDPRAIWPTAWKASLLTLALGAPVVLVGMLLVGPVLTEFLPKYVEGIPAARWALAAGAFMGTSVSLNSLFALKAWRWLIAYTIVSVSLSYVLPAWFSTLMSPLTGVAFGYFVAQVGCFVVALPCIYGATHRVWQRPAVTASRGP